MKSKFFGAGVLVAAISVAAFAVGPLVDSGLKIGDFVSAFHPNHVSGPHKGTDTCPPCTYGKMPQVQVWVNGDDPKNVETIAQLLDRRVGAWDKSSLKTFVIFLTDASNKSGTVKQIETIASKSRVKIPLAWIAKDDEAIELYAINTKSEVKNTVLVYKDMQVKAKFVNLKADENGLRTLNGAIDGIVK
jgi:hypothetical protein